MVGTMPTTATLACMLIVLSYSSTWDYYLPESLNCIKSSKHEQNGIGRRVVLRDWIMWRHAYKEKAWKSKQIKAKNNTSIFCVLSNLPSVREEQRFWGIKDEGCNSQYAPFSMMATSRNDSYPKKKQRVFQLKISSTNLSYCASSELQIYSKKMSVKNNTKSYSHKWRSTQQKSHHQEHNG